MILHKTSDDVMLEDDTSALCPLILICDLLRLSPVRRRGGHQPDGILAHLSEMFRLVRTCPSLSERSWNRLQMKEEVSMTGGIAFQYRLTCMLVSDWL